MSTIDAHEPHELIEHPERHEHKDANTRAIWWFIFGLIAFVFLSILAMVGVYRFLAATDVMKEEEQPSALAPERQIPPTPRLQTHPVQDLRAMRAEEDRALTTYGWVDESAGIVRIPIDRAIDLLAQRGLPARTPGQTAVPAAPATGAGSGERATGRPEPGLARNPRTGGPQPE